MEQSRNLPGLKSKWKKIMKGTPTKQQLDHFMRDLKRQEKYEQSHMAY